MSPRSTGILLLVAFALGAFIYFYELEGEAGRQEAAEREKYLFSGLAVEDVDWIELETRDGVDARLEQREGRWQLTAPVRFPADAVAERMADTVTSLATQSTFENPGPDAEYGLDPETATTVRFGADDASYELRLGKDTPLGAGVYARRASAEGVHTVAAYQNTAFDKSFLELREKRILEFDPTSVNQVEVRWPAGRVQLARLTDPGEVDEGDGDASAGPQWRMQAPLDARADDTAVEDLLSSLNLLRATDFSDTPTAAEEASLAEPAVTVALRMTDTSEPSLAIEIGRIDENEKRWVRAGRATLFQIPAERISDIPRETIAYRFRELSRFPLTEATKIDFFFQSPEGDPVVVQADRTDVGWEASPEPFAPGKLSRAVSELSGLEADAILAESLGDEELQALGLSPPHTIISVFGEPEDPDAEETGAKRVAEIHLGDVTPEGIVARAAGDPAVYRLPLAMSEHLPVSLDAFRTRFRAEEAGEPSEPPLGSDDALDPTIPVDESP
ncbi:MAG: DUF4340 domain-containing protein [Myxococcota bacterium]